MVWGIDRPANTNVHYCSFDTFAPFRWTKLSSGWRNFSQSYIVIVTSPNPRKCQEIMHNTKQLFRLSHYKHISQLFVASVQWQLNDLFPWQSYTIANFSQLKWMVKMIGRGQCSMFKTSFVSLIAKQQLWWIRGPKIFTILKFLLGPLDEIMLKQLVFFDSRQLKNDVDVEMLGYNGTSAHVNLFFL